MEKKNIITGGVLGALILVGVILAVVSVNRSSSSSENLSSSMKSVMEICAKTDYEDACINTLRPVAQNNNTDPKIFVKAAVKATLDEVEKALHLSNNVTVSIKETIHKIEIDDCKELLQFAIDELKLSFSDVESTDISALPNRTVELQNWLSAVVSYQQTCLDGLTKPELKSTMEKGLLNSTQLTSNALAIVTEITELLSAFHIPFNISSNGGNKRKLLEQDEVLESNSFPTWMSAGDRRLLTGSSNPNPNVVVSKDGRGNFKTITAALNAMPKNYNGRYVIYVKAGVYSESVMVTNDMVNVFMYGDGPRSTIVTGSKNFVDGVPTFQTATFAAIGQGFLCKAMGFRNTAGPAKHQAVALRVQSDRSAFFNCRMDGYQDTLYVQTHRQFYRNCVISGTIDFIFGDSAVVLQNCLIIVRRPLDGQKNTVTAHGRADRRETTGLVIHNCRIVPDRFFYPLRLKIATYLGRPWKQYSRTVVMESTIGDLIHSAGWMEWDGNFALSTLYYAEYNNVGPGAVTSGRVKWGGYRVLKTRAEAQPFTVGNFIQGNEWLGSTGVPFMLGFKV